MTTFLTLGLLSGKFNRENPIHRIKSYLGSIITDADPRIRIRIRIKMIRIRNTGIYNFCRMRYFVSKFVTPPLNCVFRTPT